MFNKKETKEETKKVINESGKLKATRPIKPQYPQSPVKLDSEIELKTKDIEIKAKGYDYKALIEIIHASLGVPSKYFDTVDQNASLTQLKKALNEESITKEKPIDVNMSELKQNVRLPRTSNNFRCPTCGQAFITKVEGDEKMSWIFRNISSDKTTLGEINIHAIDIDSKNLQEVIELYKSLNNLSSKQVVLVFNEDKDSEECFCPLCGEVHSLNDWIVAYDSPLNYFDNETICDICGKEASLIMTETSSYKECENRCISKATSVRSVEDAY